MPRRKQAPRQPRTAAAEVNEPIEIFDSDDDEPVRRPAKRLKVARPTSLCAWSAAPDAVFGVAELVYVVIDKAIDKESPGQQRVQASVNLGESEGAPCTIHLAVRGSEDGYGAATAPTALVSEQT